MNPDRNQQILSFLRICAGGHDNSIGQEAVGLNRAPAQHVRGDVS